MKARQSTLYTTFFLIALLCVGGCSKPAQEPVSAPEANVATTPQKPAASTSSQAKVVDSATAGTISGKVMYAGAAESKKIPIKGNPECAAFHADGSITSEELIVNDGALKNAFVYIQSGLDGYQFSTPTTPVPVENKDCVYSPHVIGVMTGQPIEIINSDPTLHNVHALPKNQSGWNIGLPFKGLKKLKTFDKEEVAVAVKCDVHPWMIGYFAVVNHPYFAVTKDDGSFELGNVPPGRYTLAVWHESLGTLTKEIDLSEKEIEEVSFNFEAKA